MSYAALGFCQYLAPSIVFLLSLPLLRNPIARLSQAALQLVSSRRRSRASSAPDDPAADSPRTSDDREHVG